MFERFGCNKSRQHVFGVMRAFGAMNAFARTRLDGPAARSSWKSVSTPGLFVDIGAVRPLIGLVLVGSQAREMSKHGFEVLWGDMQFVERMGGCRQWRINMQL